ncbi:porin [Acidovorax sp. Be4]|uniref:Porin n=1 Tax=Acidovorax bellezanensis TaxID=2976702 RepID=A0ABT2PJP4_9BURK|nr:porin [Acidovorax sp. Be4]MCT9810703.1 porin [Acidovorax sp. Be4]
MSHKIHQNLALGALLSCCAAACAQSSVTLYGRADAALYSQSRSHPGSNQWTLSSDTSYFGLRGQEDLGGGLSATFKLESQLDLSSGASSTAFFNREAYVGLSDRRLGTLQLGSMWGPSVWISGKADAFGRAQLGAVQTLLQGANNRGNTFKFDNAVQYISPRIGNVFGRAYVQAAEGAATGRNYALALDYSRGPAFLGLAFDSAQIAGSAVGLSTPQVRANTLGIGGAYNFGVARIHGYYQRNHVPGLADANSVNASAAIPVGAGEFRLALGRWSRPGDASAQRLALGYAHFLSKRTQLYGTFAQLKNGSRSTTMLFPISQDSAPAVAGQDVRALGVGMRHMF